MRRAQREVHDVYTINRTLERKEVAKTRTKLTQCHRIRHRERNHARVRKRRHNRTVQHQLDRCTIVRHPHMGPGIHRDRWRQTTKQIPRRTTTKTKLTVATTAKETAATTPAAGATRETTVRGATAHMERQPTARCNAQAPVVALTQNHLWSTRRTTPLNPAAHARTAGKSKRTRTVERHQVVRSTTHRAKRTKLQRPTRYASNPIRYVHARQTTRKSITGTVTTRRRTRTLIHVCAAERFVLYTRRTAR